jgi:hypothetical protein
MDGTSNDTLFRMNESVFDKIIYRAASGMNTVFGIVTPGYGFRFGNVLWERYSDGSLL